MRPIDLARPHGLSAQAVRNYESDGILPTADRTDYGYRRYTAVHADALRAFLALVPGHGHRAAAAIMRAINRDVVEEALRLIDVGHAELSADRSTLRAVRAAVDGLGEIEMPATPELHIGGLAHRVGVRPATLRTWERVGIITPRRDPDTGYRVYGGPEIRDALLARQLRRGGYPPARIATVIEQVRTAGGLRSTTDLLDDWDARLHRRGRAMLAGAGAVDRYLDSRAAPSPGDHSAS